MNSCIFFDRDGIINKRLIGDYVKNVSEFDIIPEFISLFKLLNGSDFLKIVVTNQQGIGKGLMSVEDLNNIHNHLQTHLLEVTNLNFDDIYFAPELKEHNSYNRKPNPGMLIQAMSKWNIDPNSSWMIGDSESDVIAANRAGVRSIFISESKYKGSESKPNFHYKNLTFLLDFDFKQKSL